MKKLFAIISVVIWFLSFSNPSERQWHEYKDEKIKCSYLKSHGRIDGNYVSYYSNGHKKAEGAFENNYRIGKWAVWDTSGRLRMLREYENPFVFKRITPTTPNEKIISLLNVPKYTLEYNDDGYINYFYLRERNVVWAKRIWRFIPVYNNETLFLNNLLFHILQTNIFNKDLTVYSDNEFIKEFIPTIIDTSDIQVVGYKINEDCFFDNERLLDETRIIGICPVAFNKHSKDTLDLYWAYFPQIRKYLAKQKIRGHATNIKTLDDLFFFRDFYGQIYKESNSNDLNISDYKTGIEIEKEAEKIEINMIETEHDIWITFTK